MATSYKALRALASTLPAVDLVNGPSSSRASLRLFGQDESAVRVTLYRDKHGACL
jgi:glutathione S-transferase|tara:strand:- start:1418 stop:1582 length:165 start_codon:yes stop_codon:yes gene_type:complete